MKVIMIAVSSLNGKITKGRDPNIYSWTSKEDTSIFLSEIEKHDLIVMGNKTYKAAKSKIKLKKDKLRVVLTRTPEKYASQTKKGTLEFTSESPKQLVKRFGKYGYKKMLVVGGSSINSLFLKSSLVDELYLTIEPLIFGKGTPLIDGPGIDINLKLVSCEKLNSPGTLLLKYTVS